MPSIKFRDYMGAGGALAEIGGARFAPRDTTNLIAWYSPRGGAYTDTARTTPTTTDGDLIAGYADLSGSGADALQATSGTRPILKTGANGINGKPALACTGGKSLVSTSFLTSTENTAFSLYAVVTPTPANGLKVFLSNSGGVLYVGADKTNTQVTVNTDNLTSAQVGPSYRPVDGVLVISVRYDGVTKKVNINRRTVSSVACTGNLGLSGALTIGDYSATGFAWTGLLGDILIYKTAHSDADCRLIEGELCREYSALPPNIVVDGDSITSGFGLLAGYDWPTLLRGILGSAWQTDNLAVAGRTAQQIANSAPSVLPPMYDSLRMRNIYLIMAGTNDLAAQARTPTQVYNDIVSAATIAKTAGFTVGILTLLPRDPSSAGVQFEPDRQTLYGMLVAIPLHICDFIINMNSDTLMGLAGTYSDTNYYQDGLHPYARGQQRIAFFGASALRVSGYI